MPERGPRQPEAVRRRPRATAPGPPRIPDELTVVGIGASAGGLDVCRKLLDALPAGDDMALILVQHLDPTHESMMVDLLAGHTPMTVRQAADGMLLERDHLYVIPPGAYLSVVKDALRLSQPRERHGARLPFDFLLRSLAEAFGPRAVGVILSGTGADGSVGLKAVKEKGGLVIAQDPDEAEYDGMPRSAVMTGAVDLVLPVAEIPDALIKYAGRAVPARKQTWPQQGGPVGERLPEIIDLLRTKTRHDFTEYKPGTLRRRIDRRMAMAAIQTGGMERYLELLRREPSELDLLAKDLLINVTSFFRDSKVFHLLAEKIIPDLVRGHSTERPLRIWIPGCSTGEEAYSLAMIFREQIDATKRDIRLQVFASDIDADVVATAREGFYPESVAAEVPPERLARFFVKADNGYRISPALRSVVVFTVQDLLADPPFSRLDLVSCRNLLIYLGVEAQAKAISVFHFALREGGLLLLGGAETAGNGDGRFEEISKAAHLYRHVGRSRPGDLGFLMSAAEDAPVPGPPRPGPNRAPSRQAALAELCRRLVIEAYSPAAVLINHRYECLYFLGPTDRYLRVPPGAPSHDLLSLARQGLRSRLKSAVERARHENARIVAAGGRTNREGDVLSFSIAVQPVLHDGEELLFVCFIDEAKREHKGGRGATSKDEPRDVGLEQELAATRVELLGAIREVEISTEQQKAINEDALSVQEEYQSANEELLASKEELQSLNEELTALNSQLQETLERQRTTSNDLQNVLYSTDVAILFLDTDLRIRFFTPASRSIFSIIASDVGRPIADLSSSAGDGALLEDARTVMKTLSPLEREIKAANKSWYVRRILPYRTQEKGAEGVVITFADITERKHVADALEAAKRQAELATVAKSRFLAAVSHDLRQPMQALSLVRGLLPRKIKEDKSEEALKLLERLDETAGAMSGMLDALLDINQLEAGVVQPVMTDFAVNDILGRLGDEFAYQAQAQGLTLRTVPCDLSINSDPRLLEQMIRNLLSNALKYTRRGKVLFGCRRREGSLSIEIWDTGIGIPREELQAIFEEHRQLNNAARERSRGLGLGLSIVQRLANLLGHRISVRSRPGRGSVFAVEVARLPSGKPAQRHRDQQRPEDLASEAVPRTGEVLIIEDDPEVRELLELLLKEDGHHTAMAPDGVTAVELAARGAIRPDLILADYNLPNGMNGLQVAAKLRGKLGVRIPVIVLTGDISTDTLRDIARQDCVQLNKPVRSKELTEVIQRLLPNSHPSVHSATREAAETVDGEGRPTIFVVDDDSHVRGGIRDLLEEDGRTVLDFASCEEFLESYHTGGEACLLIDAYLPGMSGLELLQRLRGSGDRLPAIMITGNSDVSMAVQAMKAGASDFIEKPIGRSELLASVAHALEQSRDSSKRSAWREAATRGVSNLTPRQRQIMDLVLAGQPSKNIAADLHISQRTVENHRASIMKKTGSKSLPALARLALAAAEWHP